MEYNELINSLSNITKNDYPDSNLNLYLHVPFCENTCKFCAFAGVNSFDMNKIDKYSELLIWQLKDLVNLCKRNNHVINSIYIGGGTPNFLGNRIDDILKEINKFSGVNNLTDITVEININNFNRNFIDLLAKHNVTKVSFGIQTFDPIIRKNVNLKPDILDFNSKLNYIKERIPIIDVDMITGLPGQHLESSINDLEKLFTFEQINSISTYQLSVHERPDLIEEMARNTLPQQVSFEEQAMMRLSSIMTLRRHGWIRRGTNTYINPERIEQIDIDKLSGNEAIGISNFDDFLIGVGSSAFASLPSIRIM